MKTIKQTAVNDSNNVKTFEKIIKNKVEKMLVKIKIISEASLNTLKRTAV